jgi:hypothetical protein
VQVANRQLISDCRLQITGCKSAAEISGICNLESAIIANNYSLTTGDWLLQTAYRRPATADRFIWKHLDIGYNAGRELLTSGGF